MDIRTWLDGTVRPEPLPSPDPLERPGPPRFLRSKEPEGQAKAKGRRGQRQWPSTSDSSLLAAPAARKRTPPTKSEADIDGSGDGSACSDAYHPAHHASVSSTSSQQYARRPRRKTRPELYEPTSKDAKERGTQLYRRPRGESNKSKRKSRRKKAAKPGVGLVQSFHAKNVLKDRLTLRPREKLGLFNKGRASTPVKGRGRGRGRKLPSADTPHPAAPSLTNSIVPDLVFSEMKFLQKHRDQPDGSAQAGSSSKTPKKDSANAAKEEISAYFTSVRPPLAENDVNIQAKEDTRRKLLPLNTGGKRERSTLIEGAMHTVELPDRGPGLGFANRGRQHESSDHYISWSDSIRAPSATPVRDGTGSLISAGQLDSIQGKQESTNTNGRDILHSHATSRPVTRHLTDYSGDLFHVSSLTSAHQRTSRPHSFPPRTSSPWRVVHGELAIQHRTIETAASSSSIEAALPTRPDANHGPRRAHQENLTASRSLSRSPPKSETTHRRAYEGTGHLNDTIMVDHDSLPSSSLGKLLHECNSAFDKQRRQTTALRDQSEVPHAPLHTTNNVRELGNTISSDTERRLSTVRFVDVETLRPPIPCYSRPSIIYQDQTHQGHPLESSLIGDERVLQNNLAMLEGDGEIEGYRGRDYKDAGWEPVAEKFAPFNFDVGAVEDTTPYDIEDGRLRHNQRNNVVVRGFWRPHKLY